MEEIQMISFFISALFLYLKQIFGSNGLAEQVQIAGIFSGIICCLTSIILIY